MNRRMCTAKRRPVGGPLKVAVGGHGYFRYLKEVDLLKAKRNLLFNKSIWVAPREKTSRPCEIVFFRDGGSNFYLLLDILWIIA